MPDHTDPLAARLAALAPAVDMPASRALFERTRRSSANSQRRWMLPAAVLTLLAVGLVGVLATGRDRSSTIPAAPAADADAPADVFESLFVGQTAAGSGTIVVATDSASLQAALAPITDPHDAAIDGAVDFGESIVVVFNVAGNACPRSLEGFDVGGPTWTARFTAEQGACDDIGLTWAHVVAVDRSALADLVEFALPASLLDRFTGGLDEPGPEHHDVIAAEQTSLPFGTILVATDELEAGPFWTAIRDTEPAFAPFVDFDRRFLVSFTLPDDSCPDRLVQFAGADDGAPGHITLIPEFEPPPGGCEQPLITRTYVIAVDRPAVDLDITFRLPGDEVYGFDSSELTVSVTRAREIVRFDEGAPTVPTVPSEPALTPTGVLVPLPDVGRPRLHIDTFGVVWVVQHADGTVSVLDAVVDRLPHTDEGAVNGLGELVAVSITGDAFSLAGTTWDEWGRTVNRPRTDDLVGYAGRVVGDEVELLLSDAATILGDPVPPGESAHILPDIDGVPLLRLDELATMSFSGPTWRYVDATLVVENGVGTLCTIDPSSPVPELATCGPAGRATTMSTTITSEDPSVTSWFFGPVLAEFDEFGEIVTVAPLGGEASRNDGSERSDELGDGDFDVLAAEPSSLPMGTLFATGNAGEYATWVLESGIAPAAPDIDFERSVAVAITTPDDLCPDTLTEFALDDGQLTPVFVAPPGGCRLALVARTYVIAIDRSALPAKAMFRVVGDEVYGYESAVATIDEAGSAGASSPLIARPTDVTAPPKDIWIAHVSDHCDGSEALVDVGIASMIDTSVIVEVVTADGPRGTRTVSVGAGTTSSVTVAVTGDTDASQQIVLRSGEEPVDEQILDSVPHVGCG